jgi:hypothetical protein
MWIEVPFRSSRQSDAETTARRSTQKSYGQSFAVEEFNDALSIDSQGTISRVQSPSSSSSRPEPCCELIADAGIAVAASGRR